MILVYKAWSISDNKPVIFHSEMVKVMQIDPKTNKVMISVTLTLDLERPKNIQQLFMVTCSSVQGLVDI